MVEQGEDAVANMEESFHARFIPDDIEQSTSKANPEDAEGEQVKTGVKRKRAFGRGRPKKRDTSADDKFSPIRDPITVGKKSLSNLQTTLGGRV